MIPRGRFRRPQGSTLRHLLPYVVAAAVFIGIGEITPVFMLNWSPGVGLLFLVAWVIPTSWRRWRK